MNANKWNFTKFIQIHNHNIYVCVRAFFIISISIHFSVAILYEPSLKFWMGKISISIPYELLSLLVVFRSHLHLIRKNSFFQVFHGLNDSHSKIWHCCLIFIISIIDVKMLRTFDFGRDIKNSNFIEWPKKKSDQQIWENEYLQIEMCGWRQCWQRRHRWRQFRWLIKEVYIVVFSRFSHLSTHSGTLIKTVTPTVFSTDVKCTLDVVY